MMTPALAAANAARRGLHILPCWPLSTRPRCRRREATCDETTVAEWWSEEPDGNVAFVPGASGLTVVSITPEGGGSAAWLGILGVETARILAPRDVVHVLFARSIPVPQSRLLAPGVRVREDHDLVMLPPSELPSGQRYRWSRARALAPLPSIVAAMLTERVPAAVQAAAARAAGGAR